jgi:hypothetical protein
MSGTFPPLLGEGCRVWTISGYTNHGPLEGPKINIERDLGGIIKGFSRPYNTNDQLLCTVQWDNGKVSKHYETDRHLICIGRYQALADFKAAIEPVGNVELVIGPQGGFREAKLQLTFDGELQDVAITDVDRLLWEAVLRPLVQARGLQINETVLPAKTRSRRSPYDSLEPNTLRVKLEPVSKHLRA